MQYWVLQLEVIDTNVCEVDVLVNVNGSQFCLSIPFVKPASHAV